MRSRVLRLSVAASVVCAAVATAAFAAQQERPREERTRGATEAAQQNVTKADSQLAACLAAENQVEIALSQLAEKQSQNPEVKKFAQTMVQDHTQFLEKLQPFVREGNSAQRAERREERREDRREGERGRTEPATGQPTERPDNPAAAAAAATAQAEQLGQRIQARRGEQGEHGINFVALKRELAQKCLQSARQELEQKQGAEFDKCYVGMQLGAHMATLNALEVFQNHATGELRGVIQGAIPTVQAHLDHAKQLMKQLESGAQPAAAAG